jgi:deoxyribodipyrimidine photolyase
MMNATTTATVSPRLAQYRAAIAARAAANAARAAAARYADYLVFRDGYQMAEVSFPNDTRNANFAGLCFYDPVTDTFRGDTEVDGYFLKRVK